MTDKPVSRTLVVMLHADVAGSTALVQRDEALAHTRITDAFRRLSSTIKDYGGTVHEIRGDALVAEFARASDALCAALVFQQTNLAHNTKLNDAITPVLRMGVSLGEVVIADETITGPGVVLAQRLEQLAEPGGVCIQQAVYEALPRHLPFDYDPLGEQQLKGFDEAVRAYAVKTRSGAQVPAPESRSKARRPMRHVVVASGAAAMLIVAVGVITWLMPWTPTIEPASEARMAFPLPDKPSIAVLPFANMSGDPEQGYFADGMTEDLITDLSKVAGLFVIARNSTFAYKGKSPEIRQVAEELGVRYVLEGSVRRADNQVRINAQLIDATTGGHVWAERYDGSLANVFAMQDEVTQKIVTALAVNLTTEEKGAQARIETKNPKAYDAFLRGWQHYLRRTPDHYVKARGYFETAIELDPKYSRAYAALASVYWKSLFEGWYPAEEIDRDTLKARAREYLDLAMTNPTALAHQVAAYMHLWRGRWDEAVAAGQRAVDRDPNDADSHVTLAEMLIYAGNPRQALDLIAKARRLDPHNQGYHAYLSGLAQFGLEQFNVAAASLERALELNPEIWLQREEFGPDWCAPCLPLAAAYAYLGRKQEAQVLLRRLREGWANANVRQRWPSGPFNTMRTLTGSLGASSKPGYQSLYRTYDDVT